MTEEACSSELNLKYPEDVIHAIQQIIPSEDPFDAPDFSSINYINKRFPAEQSLHHIDDTLEELSFKMTTIDDEIKTVVRSLTNVEQDGRTSLANAQEAIGELASRFQDIKMKAAESEKRVKEITRDIKQLDTAKRNLTSSITTLNHIQMLVEGVDKLSLLKAKREYGEIAALLQGVLKVLEHLTKYRHIPQVAALAKQVDQIRFDLEKQILQDFHSAFHGPGAKRFSPTKELAEACLVVSILDHKIKKTIIEDVIKTQLAEYEVLFAAGESDAWLNKVELRRKWFLKAAVEFEKTLAAMFPPSWQVPARLALEFCEITHTQLSKAMSLRVQEIDVGLFLQAHKIMSELEALLDRKYSTFRTAQSPAMKHSFSSNPFDVDYIDALNPFLNEESEKGESESVSPYIGSICGCFVPYNYVYLDSVDRRLSEQIEKFSNEIRHYKFEHLEAEESNVVPCCGELFTIYKNVLVEYLRLSPSSGLVGLFEIMQKHLRGFGAKVLRAALPKIGANIPLPKDLNMKELTAVFSQVQTLWREGENPKLSEDDLRRVCSVLVSAEYCEEMTSRLETKLKEKSASGFESSVSLIAEQDLFHTILSQCIAFLVTHIECQCDSAVQVIPKMTWTLEQTGDQSSYVNSVSGILSSSVPLIRHNLHGSRKYFTRFCDKLAAVIIQKFIQQVYRCHPINSVGCEQLLLDCHALKAILLHMPVVGSSVGREPPQAYTRMVSRGMSRAELVLQVVMGEYATNNELIEKFIRLLPDATISDFQKVIEMRGLKDRAYLLELYRQSSSSGSQASSGADGLPRGSLNQILGVGANTPSPEHETSKIARLERMLKARRLI